MDYTLIGLRSSYSFPDDILFLSKVSEADHKQYVIKCLKRLDEKILELIFQNVTLLNERSIGLVII